MRVVRRHEEAASAIQSARREAASAFGDGTLYVERLIERPRHIEIQIFADDHDHVFSLFERECSLQRRHQKVVEESPSPAVTPEIRREMSARRRRSGARRRLPERRHHRIPPGRDVVRSAVLLPRNEHAAPGRASGHRTGRRPRSRPRTTDGRRRTGAAVEGRAAPPARARDRMPRVRRGSGAADSCLRPGRCGSTASRRAPASVSTAAFARATRSRCTTIR